MNKGGYVYIMTNKRHGQGTVLYTGVTADLERRIGEHKEGEGSTFTTRNNCDRLVYYREFGTIDEAIQCEKRIKGGSRKKKIALIEALNPEWRDLSEDW